MPQSTRDLRIRRFRPLVPPAILLEELPLSEAGSVTVTRGRAEVVRILRQEDDRLVVVVGPCSVHDPAAGGKEHQKRFFQSVRQFSHPPATE